MIRSLIVHDSMLASLGCILDICHFFSTDKTGTCFSPHKKCVNRAKTGLATKQHKLQTKMILRQNYTDFIKKDLKVKQCEL